MSGTGPVVLGLTGSIGMGKSTVAGMFEKLGVPVFDADRAVREMQGPGGALLSAIEAEFPGTTGAQGLEREKLAGIVFDDPAALSRLEAIVHPAVRLAREQFLADRAAAPLVVFDIPLLFEKGGVDEVDLILVVSAPPEAQLIRALARPGMTQDRLTRILSLQMPDAEKRARADFVIDTGTPLEETFEAVERLVDKLRAGLPASPGRR